MYCGKCGEAVPEGGMYCPSCGAPVRGEGTAGEPSPGGAILSRLGKDYAVALTVAGALLIIVGTFLPWVREAGGYWDGGFSILGLNMLGTSGAIILILGVLCVAALVLARSGAVGPWSAVMVLLSLLALGLVFHSLYILMDEWNEFPTPSAGFWVAMVGALVITAGSWLEYRGTPKE